LLAEGADFGPVFHQKTTPKPRRVELRLVELTARANLGPLTLHLGAARLQ